MKQAREQNTEEAVDAEDLTYDKTAKQVLAARQILAPILKKSVAEFRHLSLETIARECIDGTPWVGTVPVEPGRTNRVPERIRGSQTEQSDLGEGWITFDVLFYARVPGTGKRMKFIINIEAQRSTTRYKLMKRAVFYASRLISSQKEYDFTGQDYDSICKVYTIWLCFYLPEGEASSIDQYELRKTAVYGNHHEAKENYDLINITTIHIGDDEPTDGLLRLLQLIFIKQMTEQQKVEQMRQEFGIELNDDTKKELTNMCNLSSGLIERVQKQTETRMRKEVEQNEARMRKEIKDSESKWKNEGMNLVMRIVEQLQKKVPYQTIATDTHTTLEQVVEIANKFKMAY